MNILCVGVYNEYYDPRRGMSFEYHNFYLTLTRMGGVTVEYFPLDRIREVGKKRFNRELLNAVREKKPDLVFFFMFSEELEYKTLDAIKAQTKSVAWFADDHWRLDNYSRFYAPHFTLNVTTYSKAPAEYLRYGIANVFRSQWACNDADYRPEAGKKDVDVSFVGQVNPGRKSIIGAIEEAGIAVETHGFGWPAGKISQGEMIRLFSRSKINLNLNPPTSGYDLRSLGRFLLKRYNGVFIPDIHHLSSNLRMWRQKKIPQVKARPFEIAGCGGFVISGYADAMEEYYRDGKEIVYYRSIPDLIEKIRYYLGHPGEREAIAAAGYERTVREHTYAKRFEEIFRALGFD